MLEPIWAQRTRIWTVYDSIYVDFTLTTVLQDCHVKNRSYLESSRHFKQVHEMDMMDSSNMFWIKVSIL